MRLGFALLGALGLAVTGPGLAAAQTSTPPAPRIVFSSEGTLFAIAPDGSGRVRLPASRPGGSGDSEPAWSPDGSTIAFTRSSGGRGRERSRIVLVDAEGRNPRPFGPRDAFSPSWSPDGRRLAFVRIRESRQSLITSINVARADGTGMRRIAGARIGPRSYEYVSGPIWTADGRSLIYGRTEPADGELQSTLRVVRLDGRGDRLLLRDAHSASLSPDGDRVAFVSERDRNGESCGSDECSPHGEIYTARIDGTGLRRLTRNRGDDQGPSWSSDGTRIAFSSNRNYPLEFGPDEIYSIRPDGACLTWLTNGNRESVSPAWEPVAGSTDPGGCGAVDRAPFLENDLTALRRNSFPAYWIGEISDGRLLTTAAPGYRGSLGLYYDDCGRFDPALCPKESVMLFEDPVCRRQGVVLDMLSFAKRFFVRDSVLIAHLGEFAGAVALAGRTAINISAPGLRAQLEVFGRLTRFGRGEAGPAPTALPASLLRRIRRVRSALRRLGSIRAVARERGVRRYKIRAKLRLGRVVRHLGPFRTLDC